MFSIRFWKSWTKSYQNLFRFFASITVFTICFLWFADFNAPAPVISTEHTQELETTDFNSHTFRIGTVQLNIPADAYLVFEHTRGGLLKPNYTASYLFLGIVVLGILGIVTIITTLTRFWFYIGCGLFFILAFSLRTDVVLLFGQPLLAPLVVLVLFGVPLYYFQFVNSGISFGYRFGIFVAITAILAALITFFSAVSSPFLLLSANVVIAATVLTIMFVFTVAHEILAALLSLISRGTRQTKSLQHFILISIIYVANLGLLYANKKHLIQWNFLPVNLILFLTISGVLGLWGFRKRASQYEGIIETNPWGVIFFLCLASIGFGTTAYFFASANDPVIYLIQDAVLYSHLGYGVIFFIYVIANFGDMLRNNLMMKNVMYEPRYMPYFTFRLAGLIATFVFFAYSNWKVSLHQAYAGYYNAYADIYAENDSSALAQDYYKRSVYYSIRNYHAHYALAQRYYAQSESEKLVKQYQLLVDSRPVDLAFLNLSKLIERQNSPEAGIGILRYGLHDFPMNKKIENEIALSYAALDQKDSAIYFAKAANGFGSESNYAATNLIGLKTKFRAFQPADSILVSSDDNNPGVKSNALALACVINSPVPFKVTAADSLTNIYDIISLHNYLINPANHPDTAAISNAILRARKNKSPYLKDFLLSGAAYASYANGEKVQAVKLLREVAYGGQQEKYFNTLGLWALEQNVPSNALNFFNEALRLEYQPAYLNRAIALTELHNFPDAISAWDSLSRTSDIAASSLAKTMLKVLSAPASDLKQFSNEEKYTYARYKIPLTDLEAFEDIVSSIADGDWKVRAIVDRSKQFDRGDDTGLAADILTVAKGLPLHDKALYNEIVHLNLLYLARQKEWTELEAQMKSPGLFTGQYRIYKTYLRTMLDEASGKKGSAAKSFQWLASADPYLEDAVVASIEYLTRDDPKNLQAYSKLVTALELNPDAVKLLELYAAMSIRLDFIEAGESTIARLKSMMSRDAFLRFLKKNPDIFEVGQH